MILLTGSTGFIGSHLLDALITTFGAENIVVLTSKKTDKCKYILHHNYEFDTEYILSNGYNNINTIIHTGAFTPKSSLEANLINESNSNIINTGLIINSKLPKLQNFIYISTLDVYASTENIITEESQVAPFSLYGLSKLYCEKMISTFANQARINYQILRVGHVYGPGEEQYKKIIPLTIGRLIKNEQIPLLGTGNEKRTFIYISDVVNAIIKSLELNKFEGVINVVGDETISISSLVNKLIQLSKKDAVIKRIESEVQTRDLIFNNSKMRSLLHSPEISLDQGLALEWEYTQNLHEKNIL